MIFWKSKSQAFQLAAAGTVALVAFGSPALAKRPTSIAISSGKPGSANYAEVTAMANAIDKKFGTKLRVIPVGNAVGRAIALRGKKVDIWMSCSAYYTAFEGIGDFASETWGPQNLRLLLLANRKANFSFATTKSSGIKTVADMKGKRVAWIVGNSGINMQVEAYLAFAGLTKNDVKLVKFPGYVASLRGLISGQTDVAMAANSSSATLEIAASPAGLSWIETPKDNAKGWQAVQRGAPFVAPLTITGGAGLAKGESAQVGSYPCPTFVTFEKASSEMVYWLTKMVVESWGDYSKAIKTGPYWQIDVALKSRFAVPYHEGAVKYFKEIGKWTPDMEAQQKTLLHRAEVLQTAFANAKKSYSGDKAGFAAAWESAKAKALKAAGF